MPKRGEKNVLPSGIVHLAAIAERCEHLVGVGFVFRRNRQREAVEFRMTAIAAVGCHDRRLADLELSVHHLVGVA